MLGVVRSAPADPMTCNLDGYRSAQGLSVRAAAGVLRVTWQAAGSQVARLRFGLERGAPIIREIAVRRGTGAVGGPRQ